jgi:SAM-dependent methyltransferase
VPGGLGPPGDHERRQQVRVKLFVQADLDQGLPAQVRQAGPFDVVLAADVLEHGRGPEQLLEEIRSVLVPRGVLIASVPNFGHWYPRARISLGLFDYDQRGILDQGHMRFFTRRGIRRRLQRAGFTVTRSQATGLPLEVLSRRRGRTARAVAALDRAAVVARPTLFGYQFVFQCEAAQAWE